LVNTNVIYCGDCLDILKQFPDNCIDLIYLDPPFFSNKQYEIIWGNHAELRAFGDRWKGGINHYIGWMKERLEQCQRVLKKTGLIYLHCDWHASHYLKIMMDKIFTENNFKNEIVWCYGGGGMPKQDFGRKHDIILRYSKTSKYTFHPLFKPYAETTLKVGRHSTLSGGKPLNVKGTPITDWWSDLKDLTSYSKEWLGYPTQKPESLLQRIIETSCNKEDIVLDPMVGGGTTIAVAHKLGRKWIGIDVSPTACKVAQKRMRSLGVRNIVVLGLPKSVAELKKLPHFEFQNWVCNQLSGRISDKKSGDMGIDGWTFDNVPIQVKQSEDVGRNVIDNFETAIRRGEKKKGIIVAFSFGKGAVEEVARVKETEGLDIKLLNVDEILKAGFNLTDLFKN